MKLAVLTPTMRRPAMLERALRSVFTQERRPDEIVVVDNDPEASARETVERLKAETPCPLVYVHEPRPGVATARNAGLAATDADFIACLDDDEEASPRWLAELLAVQARFEADAVFGPIKGRVEGGGQLLDYFEDFFGRQGPAESGLTGESHGCGNSLLKRATVLPGARPFDPKHDQIGGEDDAVFAALKARGGRIAWAAEAWVDEHAPSHRATLPYALKRAFAYGQGPSQTAAGRRDWAALSRWMVIGAGQAAVYGLLALIALPFGRLRAVRLLDKAVRGLGKLLWTRGFEPKVYGQAEIARSGAVLAS